MNGEPRLSVQLLRNGVADDLAGSGVAGHVPGRPTGARGGFAVRRIRCMADEQVVAGQAQLDALEEQRLAQEILDSLFGLGRMQHLVDDGDVENIDINGCDRVWVTYGDGRKVAAAPVADSDDELVEILRSAASASGCPNGASTQHTPSSIFVSRTGVDFLR